MKQPTNVQYSFSQVPSIRIDRSMFDKKSSYKATFDNANLIPYYVKMAYPGDTFNFSSTLVARILSPLNKPIMDNLHMTTFHFAVPLRLLWENFEKMMGAQHDPGDSVAYTVPQIVAKPTTGSEVGSLWDYFGLPTEITTGQLSVSALPFRAYSLIWNEWFRDQNLQDSIDIDVDDGPDAWDDHTLQKRNKRYDYFTSCLPWPQKGDASTLALGTSAPIEYYAFGDCGSAPMTVRGAADDALESGAGQLAIYSDNAAELETNLGGTPSIFIDPNDRLYADLSSATGSTINELRESFAIQAYLERDARGGTRYQEKILSQFGVLAPSDRLQRPEFLGSSGADWNVFTVPQSSESNTTDQGTLAGYATCVNAQDGYTKSFTEHCIVMSLVCVDSDLTYQRGIEREFKLSTVYDFYFPAFQNLGEQEVLLQEIYADGTASDTTVFGYNERWSHLKYDVSKICGQLRSDYATSLDLWHLAQDFGVTAPSLDSDFIEVDVPMDRIKAVTTTHDFILDAFIRNRSVRPMPVYCEPYAFYRI